MPGLTTPRLHRGVLLDGVRWITRKVSLRTINAFRVDRRQPGTCPLGIRVPDETRPYRKLAGGRGCGTAWISVSPLSGNTDWTRRRREMIDSVHA